MSDQFTRMCSPAKFYFAIFLLNILFMLYHRIRLVLVFSKIIFGCIWTYFLSWLCKKGYKSVSWFLVLLPFILIALVVVLGATTIRMNDNLDVVVVSSSPSVVSKCGERN